MGMLVVRIIVNAVILALEIAAIAAVVWLGYAHPYWFALASLVVAVVIGLVLDERRLVHEYPFYFDAPAPRSLLVLRLVAIGDALVKGVLAGIVALLTFAGTDLDRRFWVAIVFALAIFAGTSLLRRLRRSFAARPSRWGYFRLAIPLGLVFSCGLAALAAGGQIKVVGLTDLMRQLVLDIPAEPGIEHVSELLFGLQQYVDGIVATLLATILPVEWAQIVSLAVSVNVLTGFVAAIYAVVIAEMVATLERGARL
ncbi:MAG: hypothetical protein NW205_06395 [Hyphomicrobiaceae bacterium]|nr:hypothetical protein [Hyphomicrobiaceae bacterium]